MSSGCFLCAPSPRRVSDANDNLGRPTVAFGWLFTFLNLCLGQEAGDCEEGVSPLFLAFPCSVEHLGSCPGSWKAVSPEEDEVAVMAG